MPFKYLGLAVCVTLGSDASCTVPEWLHRDKHYWLIRFIIVLVFFILVLITTAQQIQSSLSSNGQDPTTDGLDSRYLPDVRPAILTIVTGTLLIMYEILQISYSPSEYIRSPYNYVDLAAYIMSHSWVLLLLANDAKSGL
ncbi:hypothetical protein B0O80DRAFT_111011 [Mortierella sp. GBAus27b]|nr:hypothetical protein B0O80DRAFT_111011 [Mortierella sp. GBAus27b]